jgi:hypothetical protein
MEFTTATPQERDSLELFYQPLRGWTRGLSFPCDASGRVDLDGLCDRERSNYLYARVVTGREFAWPVVRPARAGHLFASSRNSDRFATIR